jgi:hypothetical protein
MVFENFVRNVSSVYSSIVVHLRNKAGSFMLMPTSNPINHRMPAARQPGAQSPSVTHADQHLPPHTPKSPTSPGTVRPILKRIGAAPSIDSATQASKAIPSAAQDRTEAAQQRVLSAAPHLDISEVCNEAAQLIGAKLYSKAEAIVRSYDSSCFWFEAESHLPVM